MIPYRKLPEPVASNIRALRVEAGHSLAEAACIMGYHSTHELADVESGRTTIDPDKWEQYLVMTGRHPIRTPCRSPADRPPVFRRR
ncbi:MAG: helix-turn-helix transcriptional regulator [Burkholderiales bacterium]|nr:helix-turn-helix transcriptional regulator [Burkholderiales bacterium]